MENEIVKEVKVAQPTTPKDEGKSLELQPDGRVKGLGEMMMGILADDPATEAPGPDEPEPEAKPVEEKVAKPVSEPAPEAKRKLKWNGQEVEVPETEVVKLAQEGFDYTKKTQALAEKERSLAPLEGIAKQIQSDPRFAAHVYGYFQQPQGQPSPVAAPVASQPPVDPVDRLKWEIRQDVLKDINMAKQEMAQSMAPLNQQSVITRTMMEVQKDPLFNEVQGKILQHVRDLPPRSQQIEYNRLDQDPQSYTEMYDHFRNQIVRSKEAVPPATTPVPSGAVTRETKAPMLESSGSGAPPPLKESVRKEKISKAKAKLLAGGDVGALADWIRESGVADILRGPT